MYDLKKIAEMMDKAWFKADKELKCKSKLRFDNGIYQGYAQMITALDIEYKRDENNHHTLKLKV